MHGARMKGYLAATARRELKNAIPASARESVIAKLPEAARPLFTERLLATRWYDIDQVEGALRMFADAAREEPREFCRRIGRQVGQRQTGAIGRALLSTLATPERIARYFPAAFRQAYDSGRLQGEFDPAMGRLDFQLRDWKAHGDLMCMTVMGTLEELIHNAAGHRLVQGKRSGCVDLGEDCCRYEFELRAGA